MRSLLRLALLALPVLLALPGPAAAVVATPQVYYFSGTCDDCQGTATGELTLVNYTRGDAITADNFVSFHYDPTDLIPGGFTIVNDGNVNIGGSISDPLPGTEFFYVVGILEGGEANQLFETLSSGRWCTGYSCIETSDEGYAHLWNATPAATAVPEPASLALLGAGVLGLAAVRRRT